jgi:ribosomal protein L44E
MDSGLRPRTAIRHGDEEMKILEMDTHRTTYGKGGEFQEVLRRKSTPTKKQQVKFENRVLNLAHTTK